MHGIIAACSLDASSSRGSYEVSCLHANSADLTSHPHTLQAICFAFIPLCDWQCCAAHILSIAIKALRSFTTDNHTTVNLFCLVSA